MAPSFESNGLIRIPCNLCGKEVIHVAALLLHNNKNIVVCNSCKKILSRKRLGMEKGKCDMCRKESTIVPTGLGSYLGEKNPSICDHCKDILEPLSEQVVKLIIWEINKLQEK